MDAAISPSRVLPRQTHDQLPQRLWFRWSTRTTGGVGPFPSDEPCVPAQNRSRSDQQGHLGTPFLAHDPEQSCHDGPVAPGEPRPKPVALRDGELMPEHQDLDIFRRTRAGQKDKPPERLTSEQVDQPYHHAPHVAPEQPAATRALANSNQQVNLGDILSGTHRRGHAGHHRCRGTAHDGP